MILFQHLIYFRLFFDKNVLRAPAGSTGALCSSMSSNTDHFITDSPYIEALLANKNHSYQLIHNTVI